MPVGGAISDNPYPADQTLVAPQTTAGPSRAKPQTLLALAPHRSFEIVTRWLTILLVAWIAALLGPEGWKTGAWLLVAVSFGRMIACDLPLDPGGRAALSWCAIASFTLFLLEIWPFELVSPVSDSFIVVSLAAVLTATISIVAFATLMRALARLGGSTVSMRQWRSVQRWQLAVLTTVVLVVAVSWFSGVQVGPKTYKTDSPLAFALAVSGLGCALVAFVIYPAIAVRRLQLHLRQRFGLWSLIERGELVLRE